VSRGADCPPRLEMSNHRIGSAIERASKHGRRFMAHSGKQVSDVACPLDVMVVAN
jgi:hypothetical protein